MQMMYSEGFEARKQSYDLLVARVKEGKILSPSEMTSMTRFEQEMEESGLDQRTGFAIPDEVAEYSGYKVRTVYNAVKQGKLERLSDGTFERKEVDRWLATKGRLPVLTGKREEGKGEREKETTSKSAQFEEKRYRKARADREELLVARLKGQLVEVAEVERQFTARAHEYKTSLLLLSRRCGHKIAAAAGIESKAVNEILDVEAKELLKTMSRKVIIHVD